MDPNAVVLEISSDEDSGWTDPTGIIDGADDLNWIADILDEVNRDDDGADDSDDVILVSENFPRKPRNKSTPKSSSFDDDCVVLDHDPDKPPEPRNHDPDDDDDDDDIVVVSERGQVACRDYPHPRHLCIKFPFLSTPNQNHCDQCYCYVCDSLAPCIYWGNGSGSIDHCLATDKIDFWVLERKNLKNVGKEVSLPPPMNMAHQTPAVDHSQVPRPNPIRACPVTSSFVVPNVVSQDRNPFLLSRNKYQPGLVSQQLTRTSSCTIPGGRVHNGYNMAPPVHRPVFKRTASDGFASATNRYTYSPYYRGNYRNHFTGSSQPNVVNSNTSVQFSPRSNRPFDFPQNFHDPYVEVPVLFQPSPVPLSSQAQRNSSLPNYANPSEASRQESQRSTVDPKFFSGISWPQSQINHQPVQPAAQSSLLEAAGSTNEPSLASGSVDYGYDNWLFNNQPRETGSMDGSGPFGLREFSPDHGFMNSVLGVDKAEGSGASSMATSPQVAWNTAPVGDLGRITPRRQRDDEPLEFLQRPIGRDRAKKNAHASSSGGRVDHTEAFEKVTTSLDRLDRLLQASQERLNLKREHGDRKLQLKEMRQKVMDLNFLRSDTSHLTGPELVLAKQIKREIRERYNL